MSGSVNLVIIVGNVGRDPEVTYSQAGTPRCRFSVATNEEFKDRTSGDLRKETEWHNVVVWGKTAENCGKYLTKGRSVYVEGKQKTREYEKDGVKRYITEVVAGRVVFLGGSGGSGSPAGAGEGGHSGGSPGNGPGASGGADDDIPF